MRYSNDPDYSCLQRIAEGDHEAFQSLYQRHGLAILNYLIGLIGDRQQAEDILQNVMLIVWEKSHTFQPTGAVRGWIFGIAKRQAFKTLRRKHRDLPLSDEKLTPTEENLSNNVIKRLSLIQAIRTLPPVEQQALEMVYYRGMRLKEVASALDVPLNTIKTRLYRARQRLRIYLEEDMPDHAP